MYIVHLGISGFPTGNATIQRMRFTFKALQKAGFVPLIINKQSNQQKLSYKKKVNRFDGLLFLYTSPLLIRPDGFFKRNINKLQGLLREFAFLSKRRKKINSAILYTQYFWELVYYKTLSKLFGFKLVIQYVEYRSSIPNRNSFFTSLNDKLYDKYCYKFCDGVIVISEFLKTEIQKRNSHLPLIKIPAICDFNDFEIIPAATTDFNYFLYCGTIDYMPVINFVLSVFEKAKDQQIYNGKLMCIIGGNNLQNFDTIEKSFRDNKYSQDIILYKNLPYNDIIPLYKSADLLLIPLRNTIQDIARFPHKVSEYTASGRPLISSKIGELKYYFEDKESALLSDEYDIDMYVERLRQIKSNNISFDTIGYKGYEVGYQNFHYESNVENMKKFFNDLVGLN
jgi:glycosyltransferase involved in cell wall biosynthesis